MRKDLKQLLKKVRRRNPNINIYLTKRGGHMKVDLSDGRKLIVSTHPSRTAFKNLKADLKREGLL